MRIEQYAPETWTAMAPRYWVGEIPEAYRFIPEWKEVAVHIVNVSISKPCVLSAVLLKSQRDR